MPYEVEREDGMKIQVSSLNGHDWSVYREKLVCVACRMSWHGEGQAPRG